MMFRILAAALVLLRLAAINDAAFRMLTKEEIAYMFREPGDPRNVSILTYYSILLTSCQASIAIPLHHWAFCCRVLPNPACSCSPLCPADKPGIYWFLIVGERRE